MTNYSGCPGSVSGHGRADSAGHCPWCGKKIDTALPRPQLGGQPSDLTMAYGEHYDPDYGTRTWDEIRRAEQLGWSDVL